MMRRLIILGHCLCLLLLFFSPSEAKSRRLRIQHKPSFPRLLIKDMERAAPLSALNQLLPSPSKPPLLLALADGGFQSLPVHLRDVWVQRVEIVTYIRRNEPGRVRDVRAYLFGYSKVWPEDGGETTLLQEIILYNWSRENPTPAGHYHVEKKDGRNDLYEIRFFYFNTPATLITPFVEYDATTDLFLNNTLIMNLKNYGYKKLYPLIERPGLITHPPAKPAYNPADDDFPSPSDL